MGSVNLWSCRNAGSLSAPLRGSTAAAAWPRIGSASTERPWRSCVSPQSASCSENSAIRPEVSGQTLSVAYLGEAYLLAGRAADAAAAAMRSLKLAQDHKERGHEAY